MISVYGQKTDCGVTIREAESIKRYVALIQWGRKNPVQFVEKILQISLIDYQKWLIAMSWDKEYVVWACSRNAGKSFLVSIIMLARSLLFPKTKIHILSVAAKQAMDTFSTMESIAKNQVKTLISDNSVFRDEIVKMKSDSDGFTHDAKKGSNVTLLNGSFIQSVSGTAKTVRGKRSNLNVYDEAGFIGIL
nr:MAG TPA: Terminase large subunit [Caudoviricetes sp.]